MEDISRYYKEFVVLTGKEAHAVWDVKTLKNFKPALVKVFTSGHEAIRYLEQSPLDIVLCDTELSDMDGVEFIFRMRKRVTRKMIPVVMVTTENRRTRVLDAIGAGCGGYILRPYSLKTFEKHLRLAKQVDNYAEIEQEQVDEARNMVRTGEFDSAIQAFREVLSMYTNEDEEDDDDVAIMSMEEEARRYYDMGCKYLMRNKFGQAIIAFRKAVKINSLFAEAYAGLADAFQGKGDDQHTKEYLSKAAEIHAQMNNLEQTKIMFIKILQIDDNPTNPYNTLGVKLRQKGDYPGAVHAYKQALELTPDDERLYYNIAKAYCYTAETEKAKQYLHKALTMNPNFDESKNLYQEITGEDWSMAAPFKEVLAATSSLVELDD